MSVANIGKRGTILKVTRANEHYEKVIEYKKKQKIPLIK